MKKIAILTQPLRFNYGGIIQNYALQKILKKKGFDPITINRKKNKTKTQVQILKSDLIKKLKNLVDSSVLRLTSKEQEYLFKNNLEFLRNNINLTEVIDSNEKMIEHFNNNKYDAIIVGSDQTWRPKYSPNIFNYFLDFADNKNFDDITKISYASSFGTSKWEYNAEEEKTCRQLAQQFNAISVREVDGIHLCNKYLNVDSCLVLDPVILLSKDDYNNLLINKDSKSSSLYTYILDRSPELNMILAKISKKHDFKISNQQDNPNSNLLRDRIKPPIEDWINGFRNAEFVITDSFHGTLFSIIYNKPFISIINTKRGESRFTSILGQLDLLNRLVRHPDEITEKLINEEINYVNVNSKLEELRNESIQFLLNNLN